MGFVSYEAHFGDSTKPPDGQTIRAKQMETNKINHP